MLSTFVIVPGALPGAPPASGALVRTLAALVPATVEGLVRDVTVIAPRRDDALRRVTEHAGCGLVEEEDFDAALKQAIARARSPFLFLLRAGAHLNRDFLDEAAQQFGPDVADPASRSLLIREAPDRLMTRVLPDLAPVAGLIASAGTLAGPAKTFDSLVRRIRASQTLTARASMAR